MSHSHRRPRPPRRGAVTLVRATRPAAVPGHARQAHVPAARHVEVIGHVGHAPAPAERPAKATDRRKTTGKAPGKNKATGQAGPGQRRPIGPRAARLAKYGTLAAVLTIFVAVLGLGLKAVSGSQGPTLSHLHPLGLSLPVAASLAGVFLALLAAPLLVFGRWHRQDKLRNLDSRIGPYVPVAATGEGQATGTMRTVTRLLRYRGTDHKVATRLDLAGMRRKPADWVVLCAGASVAGMALLTIVTGNPLAGIVVGASAGWGGARLVLNFLISRRRASFTSQLPDTLELIAGSLQSGLTLARALDAVVNQEMQPTAAEFARALSDVRLGAGVEDALESVADRMDSADLRWAIMAVRIHRSVGGNLVEILHNVMATMREREYLRRQIKSLSAEGRLSAYVLIALPILIGGWLFYSSPAYMHTMYTTAAGLFMLAGAAGLIVVGTLWMRKLIRIEV